MLKPIISFYLTCYLTNNYCFKRCIYMSYLLYIVFSFTLFLSCQDSKKKVDTQTVITTKNLQQSLINKNGTTIKTRFNPPEEFTRIQTNKNTFAHYLQNFPLKPHGSEVHLYNGDLKYRQDVHAAILDIDVGNRDLQQCADATMRLRAEYLYGQKEYDKISFNFTNGFKATYSKWRKAYRIRVQGNKVNWIKTNSPSVSYKSFRKYLVMVFSYAGTLSLEKELPSRQLNKLEIGDIFIQGGSPGHAIIVVDMAVDKNGNKIFMLAQSYMPAQDIHILTNPNDRKLSPWYATQKLEQLITPEWTFTKDDLKRFH